MSTWSQALLNLLICVGLLAVMPLGLRLVAAPGAERVHRLWFLAATPAATSVWLPRGWLAAVLAAAYLPATTALLVSAARLVLAHRGPTPTTSEASGDRGSHLRPGSDDHAGHHSDPGPYSDPGPDSDRDAPRPDSYRNDLEPGIDRHDLAPERERHGGASQHGPDSDRDGARASRPGHGDTPRVVAVATALAAPTVAAFALVAERAGYQLFGFELDVLALTVAHFHYAGFAAALIAGLVCEVDSGRPAGRLAALSVPAGVVVVFAGFFTSEWVELAGAAVLTAGMWLVGWLTWRRVRASGAVRGLLLVSAATLVVTMLLALDWALGEATGLPHLPLSWMVATHGLANAVGFALCGLVAWQILAADRGIPTTTAQRLVAGQRIEALKEMHATQAGATQQVETSQQTDAKAEARQETSATQQTSATRQADAGADARQVTGTTEATGARQKTKARQETGARRRMKAGSEWH